MSRVLTVYVWYLLSVHFVNCQNIHTSHIRFGDVVVLTTTFIGRRGHATYDQPGATRGSRSRVTVHTSRGEELLRGVTRTSSFHPRSSRPIRFLRISYHTRHPSRAPAPCLGHQLPRPEPLRSPTGTLKERRRTELQMTASTSMGFKTRLLQRVQQPLGARLANRSGV